MRRADAPVTATSDVMAFMRTEVINRLVIPFPKSQPLLDHVRQRYSLILMNLVDVLPKSEWRDNAET